MTNKISVILPGDQVPVVQKRTLFYQQSQLDCQVILKSKDEDSSLANSPFNCGLLTNESGEYAQQKTGISKLTRFRKDPRAHEIIIFCAKFVQR